MKRCVLVLASVGAVCGSTFAGGGVIMDGFLDPAYADAIVVQDTNTQFGDSQSGTIDFAGGSELDGAYAVIQDCTLYLLFVGNLESNFNKLEVFLDYAEGGQSRLLENNPAIDAVDGLDSGLPRMGDDGSGNGLTFDDGFEADYWLVATCGDTAPFRYEVRYAELPTAGGGAGGEAGVVNGGGGANVISDPVTGIQSALDNTNIAGVQFDCQLSDGSGVPTGVEFAIPLDLLGNPDGDIRICAFINGTLHDFLSNQVLGPLGGDFCNLAEPRTVNFALIPGDQFFTVPFGGGCVSECPADLDGNDDVGFSDLVELLANWGPCVGCPADLDGNDDVGFSDLVELLANWGPCV